MMVKHIFLARYAKIKTWKNCQFFDQTLGLTPLKKSQFLGFIIMLFLKPRKAFFLSRTSSNTFSCDFLAEKEIWKNCQFLIKPMEKWKNGKCFGKIPIFSTCLIFSFCSVGRPFFLSRISWNIFSWPILSNTKTQKNLEYCKIHFPVLFCRRQKDGKISNFGLKPWTNPLEKILILWLY